MKKLIQNERAFETLAGWIRRGRFQHAILLEGPQGSGRKTFAHQIATAILCSGEPRPCGTCAHCVKMEKNIHPDFHRVQGGGGPRSFHVEQVRDLRKEAYISANEAKAKVFLLLNTQEMTVQAQNALLKIMEEPPKGVYFIAVCENRQQMLPTIQSRVVTVTMQVPQVEQTAELLPQLAEGKSPEEYQRASLQAGGNVGRALLLLEDAKAEERYQKARDIFAALLEGKELAALSMMEDCQRDKELFIERVSLLRSFAVALLLENQRKHHYTALQLTKIVDIIDELAFATESNVNLLLLSTLLCSKIRGVLSTR